MNILKQRLKGGISGLLVYIGITLITPVFIIAIIIILAILGKTFEPSFPKLVGNYYYSGYYATIPSWRWHMLFSIVAFIIGFRDFKIN